MFGGDDAEIEAVWNKEYSLSAFTDASNFKTFEELETRLNSVLNSKPAAPKYDESLEDESEGLHKPATSDWTQEIDAVKEKTVAAAPAKDDDDVMSYFASLASEE
tara:strand:- start:451 stop:765 length:315 start_codon:yes stop_codon:yes gene_type:complete